MAFDESAATDVRLRAGPAATVVLQWDSAEPDGTPWQVYADGVLAWLGVERLAILPAPATWTTYHVGSVAPGEDRTDFSATLDPIPGGGNRPLLEWSGGTFLAADIVAFRIYGESTPGGGVSYATVLGTVLAYPQGTVTDGYGSGGYGSGGYGYAGSTYAWRGPPYGPGTWTFAVVPVNTAGVEGTAATVAVAIAGPPRPPAANAAGQRLTYTYNAGTGVATLSWLASPA